MFSRSRILLTSVGSKVIKIPEGVQVSQLNEKIFVRGPLGELSQKIPPTVRVFRNTLNELRVIPLLKTPSHGRTRALIDQMIIGSTMGWFKELELHGIGYRASLDPNPPSSISARLVMRLGFSHDVIFDVPKGVDVKLVSPTFIVLSGIDKHSVTLTASMIRNLRKPDPYKGKGIRYHGEVVKLLPGKKK